MLEAGIKGHGELVVTEDVTAVKVGSGELNVLATPAMIALIEKTAWQSVAAELEPGWGTVGGLVNVSHLAPTPLGMKGLCDTVLTAVEGRKLVFEAVVFDECGEIGRGTHERFTVNNERFADKALKRSEK